MSVSTGSLPGVRIVDMPDLGAFTDDSSLVGEHAGSGRFTAFALRDYMGRGIVNVLDHGARGDGSTDDTAAIQAVLNTYAGKALVLIPNTGMNFLVNPLYLPSNTTLILDGTLLLRANAPDSLLVVQSVNNVSIYGTGTADGNKAAQTSSPGPLPATLSVFLCSNVTVRDVTLARSSFTNLNVQTCTKVRIDNVKMIDGTYSQGFAVNCDDCWMTNCIIEGPDFDIGMAFYSGVTNSGVIGCTIKNSGMARNVGAAGIAVYADVGQPYGCSNIIIADNVVHHCGAAGIEVEGYNATTGQHSNILITNNRIYDCARVSGSFTALDIGFAKSVTVSGNKISDCGNADTICYGMSTGGSSNIFFIGNQVFNIGAGLYGNYGLVVNTPTNLLASGNHFYDDQTTPTMGAGIGGTAGANNAFIGNFSLLANLIAPASDTVATDGTYMQIGTARFSGTLQFTNASHLARWFVGNQGNAEGTVGSNTGSDFEIVAVNDAGTSLIPSPILITRATGIMTLGGPPLINPAHLPINAVNDAAAATAGVVVGGFYRNGSALMIRVV